MIAGATPPIKKVKNIARIILKSPERSPENNPREVRAMDAGPTTSKIQRCTPIRMSQAPKKFAKPLMNITRALKLAAAVIDLP